MLGIFCIICCIGAIAGWALLNRIFYAVYRPWCKKINIHISTVIAHRIFSIFQQEIPIQQYVFLFLGDL